LVQKLVVVDGLTVVIEDPVEIAGGIDKRSGLDGELVLPVNDARARRIDDLGGIG
jgi:hypothetical protein